MADLNAPGWRGAIRFPGVRGQAGSVAYEPAEAIVVWRSPMGWVTIDVTTTPVTFTAAARAPVVVAASVRQRRAKIIFGRNRPEWGLGVPTPDAIVIGTRRRLLGRPNAALVYRNGPVAAAAPATASPEPLVVQAKARRRVTPGALIRRNALVVAGTARPIVVTARATPRRRGAAILGRNPAAPAVVATPTPRPIVVLRQQRRQRATVLVRRGAPTPVVFVPTPKPIVFARPLRRRKGFVLTVHGYFPPAVIAIPGRGGSETYLRALSGSDVYMRPLGGASTTYALPISGSEAYLRSLGGSDTYLRSLGGSNA